MCRAGDPPGRRRPTSQRFRLDLRKPEETRPDECRADRLCRHRRHRHDDRYRSFRTRLFHYCRPHGRGPRDRTGAPAPGRPAPDAHAGSARGPHRLQGPPLHQGRPLAGHGLLPTAVPHARGRLRTGPGRTQLCATAHRARRLVGLGRRAHRLAVHGRDRGPDDPALAPDPGRPGRPALRPGLRRRQASAHLALRRVDVGPGEVRRGHDHRGGRLRAGPADARARPPGRFPRPGRARPGLLDALPADGLDRRPAQPPGHQCPGQRDPHCRHHQGGAVDDLVRRRGPPALDGRGLAPVPGDPQRLRAPRGGRLQGLGPAPATHDRRRAPDRGDHGHAGGGHGGRRLRRGPRGQAGRGPHRGLHLEGPAGLLHLHRVRPLPGPVPGVEHRQAPVPQAVRHGTA